MNQKTPRGLRNNNPLNIRRNSIRWKGMKEEQKDKDFVQFKSMLWGYRAAFKIMQTYVNKHHCKTLHDIISRWAPPSENNTKAYEKFVAGEICTTPLSPLPPFSDCSFWVSLVLAMTLMENGYSMDKLKYSMCEVFFHFAADAYAVVFH